MAGIIINIIKNTFSPTPVSVTFPSRFKVGDRASGEQIEAYSILVTYKNGRIKGFSFPVDNKSGAYTRAMNFYLRQRERVKAYYILHCDENIK